MTVTFRFISKGLSGFDSETERPDPHLVPWDFGHCRRTICAAHFTLLLFFGRE
jgi:hypothetical protein